MGFEVMGPRIVYGVSFGVSSGFKATNIRRDLNLCRSGYYMI
jgi:hypothetical protein